jgi:hypothetical protein
MRNEQTEIGLSYSRIFDVCQQHDIVMNANFREVGRTFTSDLNRSEQKSIVEKEALILLLDDFGI